MTQPAIEMLHRAYFAEIRNEKMRVLTIYDLLNGKHKAGWVITGIILILIIIGAITEFVPSEKWKHMIGKKDNNKVGVTKITVQPPTSVSNESENYKIQKLKRHIQYLMQELEDQS